MKNIDLLKKSCLFDRDWYLNQYPDVVGCSFSPEEHYLLIGERLGRQPSKIFDHKLYEKLFEINSDVKENLLVHCIKNNLELFLKSVDNIFGCDSNKDFSIFDSYISKVALSVDNLFRVKQNSFFEEVDFQSAPLVSVIMPTWNRGDIINEAILSVLQQSYGKWELLIVDDGSDDDTEIKVNSFKDVRVKYTRLKKGNGAIARNHGLRSACGEIIAFLDSDNIWSPSYLQWIVNIHLKGNLTVYTGFLDAVFEENSVSSCAYKFKEFDFNDLAFRNFIDLNTFSFNSKLLDIFGVFDPSLPRQQDWDLITRYSLYFPPYGLDKPLVFYRRNKDWNQVTITKKHIDTRSIVMKKNSALVCNYNKSYNWKLNRCFKKNRFNQVKNKIAIKISAPNEEVGKGWGDYYFAHQLGSALQKYGWKYEVHCQDKWYGTVADVNIVLRGRHRFDVSRTSAPVNIVWIISHPDRLVKKEIDDYLHIFVASEVFVEKIKKVTNVPASVLHQATDENVFGRHFDRIENIEKSSVFIGNSRNQYRLFVDWAIKEKLPLLVWGREWENFLTDNHWIGGFIDNSELGAYYSSAGVLLNDHWDSMRNNGFISNRLFDASAAGGFVITDDVKGVENVFGDSVLVAKNSKDLKLKVEYYLKNPLERKVKINKARSIVLENHTFDNRAKEIDSKISNLFSEYYLVPFSASNTAG